MYCINLICEHKNPRLAYILQFIEERYQNLKFLLSNSRDSIETSSYTIHYTGSENSDSRLWIYNSGALEFAISNWPRPDHRIQHGEFQIYFLTGTDHFDFFSAIFYLLARVEEYQTFEADEHERFTAKSSLLFNAGQLQKAVVDEWVELLIQKIENAFNINILPSTTFDWSIGFDIDQAWKYQHKSIIKFTGRLIKLLFQFNIPEISRAIKQYFRINKDVYDQYSFISSLGIPKRQCYFFILAGQQTLYDASHTIESVVYKHLLLELNKIGFIGIHPGYSSMNDAKTMMNDIEKLNHALDGSSVIHSRQHFLRLQFPQSYSLLENAHIKFDYSLGYADQPGFRAGTCHSFLWYNIEDERITDLRIIPLIAMDRTFQKYHAAHKIETLTNLHELIKECKQHKGHFHLCWHNSSFDFENEWKGFESVLETVIDQLKLKG